MRSFILMLKIVLAVLLFPVAGISQVTQAWATRFLSGPNFLYGPAAMTTDAAGDVYIAGTTKAFSTMANFLTIKYNSAGELQWAVAYNGPTNHEDEAVAIAADAAGNVYVTGSSRDGLSSDGSNTAIATIKYSAQGVPLWVTRTETGTIANGPSALTVDAAGNVYITGNTISASFAYDYLTVKLNSAGVQQWAEIYNGTANNLDFATAIAVDNSGNVYVTGESMGENRKRIDQFYDYLTIKYNASGATIWTNRYNGPGNTADMATALALDASANVYVTGGSGKNAVTIAYATDGTQQWVDRDTLASMNTAIAVDPSGNIVTAGYLTSAPDFLYYNTTKYTASGSVAWSKTYVAEIVAPGSAPHVALGVDREGNSYIAGSLAVSPTSFDYAIVKYGPGGNQDWVTTFNGPANGTDIPTAIAVLNPRTVLGSEPFGQASICVTGLADETGNAGGNYTTVKYTQSLVLAPASANLLRSATPNSAQH